MAEDRNILLCLGFGYVARALAATLDRGTWAVIGTVHRGSNETAAEGVTLVLFDDAGDAIARATHILVSVPPDENGDPVLGQHGSRFAGSTALRWLGYLSTTGVYGDTGGRTVDESAALVPTHERGRRRVKAEFAWQDHAKANALPLHIFRLAGIYGPGRNVLDQVRDGTARRIVKPGHAFSRIHVDDIVQALTLSMAKPQPDAIYNLCDDEAAEQAEVVAYACRLLGAPVPPPVEFEEAVKTMSPMARSFWDDQRLIDNSKIKRDLGFALRYSMYREGLTAILEGERGPTTTGRGARRRRK